MTTKTRSYEFNKGLNGRTVTFTATHGLMTRDSDGENAGRLVEGQEYTAKVRSVSNAGFRGIEFAGTLEDGRRFSGHTTGTIITHRI